ncbi:MAG: NADH-quinone oxidoreductase subunit C [Deltaproteobacteria bacterium]|nr:NADH-quinone oxidoreductase subunit C [Deltaproteobacteria bacterium]
MAAEKEELLINKVKSTFRDDVLETSVYRGDVTHVVDKKALRAVCNFLKTDPELKMNFLVDIAGVDYHPETPRFEVVYHLYSITRKHRICIKVRVNDGEPVPSVTSIWPGADWPEREAYDMFGIVFEGHPDLKRIYLAEDWEGFPLRKDYPLKGYKDRYNPYGEEKPEKI